VPEPAAEIHAPARLLPAARPPRACTLDWILARMHERDIHRRGQPDTCRRLMGVTPPST